ncbi:catabolic 3-dehydroquinase [Neurospora tetrasperma FGSC 2508]|uniref:Catabolic 3-dehydroquinase n=1 Tax=Neurospora tetrasperma (strain FGSC 2508 / ATCC MYA-4615 / P0657) TaxID=510951 RepID=F8MTZ5_NEUT8|nr:catabolic 3-dehydroquinase [Neurospora tetrasperma FGSC 2508]EGO55477.1 catabolic 3-dehydroquinase [Neurospora tetrasperma FGSC 2508]EGZ69294.1 catabolic 3-dehydroquinase [Neurospora tetrasperma FGSC 2509]
MASRRHILLINGPNLNLLGTREPQIYGSTTLHDIEQASHTLAFSLGLRLTTFQSNHEGAIIDRIHQAAGFFPSPPSPSPSSAATTTEAGVGPGDKVSAIIINPGAYTHTSIGIRDALLGTGIPFVEVHVSNVHAREAFRHHSYLSDKAVAVICGLGPFGYSAALEFLGRHMKF